MGIAVHRELYKIRFSITSMFLLLIVLCTATFLRASLLIIYPFLVVLFLLHFRMKLVRDAVVLLLMIMLGWLLSFTNGWYPLYNLVSFFYIIPFLLLFFAAPSDGSVYQRGDLVRLFFRLLTVVGIVNNVVGFMQILSRSYSDDNFTGIYATFTISLNGLVIVNMILAFYYLAVFLANKRWIDLVAMGFFMVSAFLGFFGAGLLIFILAVIFTFLRLTIMRVIKGVLIAAAVLFIAYYGLLLIRPKVLAYNKNNVVALLKFDMTYGPRKLIVFYNYGVAYPPHLKDFLFGSGPGTFNSRSAFMVGSPSYFSVAPFLKSEKKPYYFENYAYTLWNDSNTSQRLFQDGFRNQPFSAVLAFLGEYGLLATILLVIAYFFNYKRVKKRLLQNPSPLFNSYKLLFKFLTIFLLLLLLVDNFLEYPEIILLIVAVMQLIHIEAFKKMKSPADRSLPAS